MAWLVRLAVPANARFPEMADFRATSQVRRAFLADILSGYFSGVTAQVVVARYEDSIVSQIVVSIAGLADHVRWRPMRASWFKAESCRRGRRMSRLWPSLAAAMAADRLVVRRRVGGLNASAARRASCSISDNPLEIARTAVADERELRIVAMGSSSTQGYGTTNPQFAYPAQLKMKLEAAMPGVDIHVYNKGIGGQDADEMVGAHASRREARARPPRGLAGRHQFGDPPRSARPSSPTSCAPASISASRWAPTS